jgi:asparagine synthetase B (glutamine-hydrolysing)
LELTGGNAPVSVGLAHARLSILDPTARADQPFRRGDHVLCYNGEIYNFRELASQHDLSSALTTTGDTEVLLALLSTAGLGSLSEARGMWAFTWLDMARRRLVAARDRYGKKPLFYIAGPSEICSRPKSGRCRCSRAGRSPSATKRSRPTSPRAGSSRARTAGPTWTACVRCGPGTR